MNRKDGQRPSMLIYNTGSKIFQPEATALRDPNVLSVRQISVSQKVL